MAYLDNVYAVVQIAPTGIPTYVRLSQNENGRVLNFAVSGDALPAGSTVALTGTKPDGAVYSASGTLADNVATFNEDEQLTAVAGEWDAKVEVTNSGNLIATGRIKFVIDADPSGGNIPSDSQLDGYIAEMLSLLDAGKAEAYGSPLVASTVAGMTDQSRVYVYTGSETGYTAGNWYYWNGSSWTSGGVYNAVAVSTDTTLSIAGKAADAKATGDALDGLKDDLSDLETNYKNQYVVLSNNLFNKNTVIRGKNLNSSGEIVDSTNSWVSEKIFVEPSTQYYIWGAEAIYDADGDFLQFHSANDPGLRTMPENASYIICAASDSQLNMFYVNKGSSHGYDEYKEAFKSDLIQVDDSLTQSGYPADAKTVGDIIDKMSDVIGDEIVLSYNLFDKNNVISGKTLNGSGAVVDNNNYWLSQKIPVEHDMVYYIWGNAAIYNAQGTFLHFHSINDAGLYTMDATASYIVCTGQNSHIDSYYVNKYTSHGVDMYKSVSYAYAKQHGLKVSKSGGGDYTSLTKALWDNIGKGLTFYVDPGEYDLTSEYPAYFGSDVFDASKFDSNDDPIAHQVWYEGLPIKDSYVFCSPKAIIKFNYTGSVQGVIDWFSPFKFIAPGGELHGGQIVCSNCRYAIHDDCYWSENDRRITDGVYIYYRSSRNVAIGGGLGKSSYVEVKNCYVDSTTTGYGIWYHNATLADAQNFVSIHDNNASASIEIQALGPSTLISKALVSNNKCHSVEKIANVTEGGIDNFEMVTWNNVTS